jgi:hypothetical protein
MALTQAQKEAAQKLLEERPPVVPGTCAIIDQAQAETWQRKVVQIGREQGVTTQDWWQFCDIAGVAD